MLAAGPIAWLPIPARQPRTLHRPLFGTPDADPGWSSEQFAPLHWTVAQFSEPQRQAMRALPACLRLPEAPDLLLVHASARGDHDTSCAYTPEAQLHEMFPGVSERWVVRGHNHLCQVRLWERGVIITSGSVGMPLDGNPTAQYLLLDQGKDGWNVQHQSVPYSLQAMVQRFESSGYLKAAGPMARLYLREIQTGSPHIVPFLRAYHHWRKESCRYPRRLNASWRSDRFYGCRPCIQIPQNPKIPNFPIDKHPAIVLISSRKLSRF
jgi:hypothetical protein